MPGYELCERTGRVDEPPGPACFLPEGTGRGSPGSGGCGEIPPGAGLGVGAGGGAGAQEPGYQLAGSSLGTGPGRGVGRRRSPGHPPPSSCRPGLPPTSAGPVVGHSRARPAQETDVRLQRKRRWARTSPDPGLHSEKRTSRGPPETEGGRGVDADGNAGRLKQLPSGKTRVTMTTVTPGAPELAPVTSEHQNRPR